MDAAAVSDLFNEARTSFEYTLYNNTKELASRTLTVPDDVFVPISQSVAANWAFVVLRLISVD